MRAHSLPVNLAEAPLLTRPTVRLLSCGGANRAHPTKPLNCATQVQEFFDVVKQSQKVRRSPCDGVRGLVRALTGSPTECLHVFMVSRHLLRKQTRTSALSIMRTLLYTLFTHRATTLQANLHSGSSAAGSRADELVAVRSKIPHNEDAILVTRHDGAVIELDPVHGRLLRQSDRGSRRRPNQPVQVRTCENHRMRNVSACG